jgi:hypothetical protein
MANVVDAPRSSLRTFQPRHLAIAQGLAVAALAGFWTWAVTTHPEFGGKAFGVDAAAYWAADLRNPYGRAAAGLPGAYLYSPAFLHVFTPFHALSWEWFTGIWVALQLAALAWLLTPLGALLALATPAVTSEVLIGNLHILYAVALVVSIRHPAAWSLPALTKPTLGIGIAWYLGRRQWLRAAIALLAILAIASISFAIAPALWLSWFHTLTDAQQRGGPWWTALLAVRLLLALALSWYAGMRNMPAFLPVALYLALPIPWPEGLTMLAAVPRLVLERRRNVDR